VAFISMGARPAPSPGSLCGLSLVPEGQLSASDVGSLIDETAAMQSAAWGLTQILAENFSAAGYATPQAMVLAFIESEAAHLEAWIVRRGAAVAGSLRSRHWLRSTKASLSALNSCHGKSLALATLRVLSPASPTTQQVRLELPRSRPPAPRSKRARTAAPTRY
jgi:hypothetical protein